MSSRLSRIFIRAQNEKGKWVNVSLEKATDEQFSSWIGRYLFTRIQEPRENLIRLLDDIGIAPVELKEGYDEVE